MTSLFDRYAAFHFGMLPYCLLVVRLVLLDSDDCMIVGVLALGVTVTLVRVG